MSEIWKRKMKKYFSTFDFDKDGFISEKDFLGLGVAFSSFGEVDKQKVQDLMTQLEHVWKLLSKNAEIGNRTSLTSDELSASLRKLRYDPKLMKPFTDIIHHLHDMLDVSRDGYLQEDEYQRIISQAGVPDPSFVKEAFKAIDVNGDGKLSIEEFANAFFDFLFSDDENSPYAFFFGPLDD